VILDNEAQPGHYLLPRRKLIPPGSRNDITVYPRSPDGRPRRTLSSSRIRSQTSSMTEKRIVPTPPATPVFMREMEAAGIEPADCSPRAVGPRNARLRDKRTAAQREDTTAPHQHRSPGLRARKQMMRRLSPTPELSRRSSARKAGGDDAA